jgi:hypothetical protein
VSAPATAAKIEPRHCSWMSPRWMDHKDKNGDLLSTTLLPTARCETCGATDVGYDRPDECLFS